jgi:hypothetical protein
LHSVDEGIVVFASGNYMEAELVACALDGHEIESFVFDDNVCRIFPQAALVVGGAKVIVNLRDAEGATDVLRLVFGGEPPFAGHFLTVPLSKPAAILAMFRMWRRRKTAKEPL